MKNTLIKFMKDGKLTREIEIHNDVTHLTEYDKYGNIVHVKNNSYESHATIVNGKVIFEEYKYTEGNISNEGYVYDDKGNNIYKICTFYSKETGKYTSSTISNEYNEEGKCIAYKTVTPEKTFSGTITYEDNKQIITNDDGTKEIFTFNENGNCIKMESDTYNNFMEYDEHGNLIYDKNFYLLEDGKWSCTEEIKTYNEHGDEISYTIIEDGVQGETIHIDVFYIEEE